MEKTLLDIVLILVFTKIGGIISRKLKMPEVLGALIAGVVLGPMLLNLVQYDDNIKLLSNLGVIMLMFLAGLETNVEELKKAGLSSFVIAVSGIIVPLVLGTLSAYMFFNNFWENIFVGVILTATSVSITVETLKELGKLNTRSGINILGAAVIDDILGLILISLILAMAQTSDPGTGAAASSLVFVFIKVILFCVCSIIGIVYLPKHINKFTRHVKPGRELLVFSIAFALLIAFAAESLGIAAITGAYIGGLILSSLAYREYLERNVKAISSGFLSLVFFASVGIEANLKGLNLEVVLITIVMFVVALVGKVLGCGGAARLLKMSRGESLQIGTGMISRGEVAIITANIGLQKGIISGEIFVPTLIVVILTTIVTPVLLKMAFSHKNEKRMKMDKIRRLV
ncbi:MAG: cation:proton antiporter [Clostridium sp.]|jgi:Kef-type K+ transport system membrane component KefB|uniref:cation:proton antiporter n=1 Tax=Clostridium sp. TaxID=1506 RepID=UPI0025BB9FC3|nr:cation:proton antiporter [Clostridium sp.]MCH3965943.1 cation:proton antiporter [Clostridium sp.]MCI1715968.1 cation:proton antiporter [Clostridium sp.]MCI1800360.1 cation:proton antiporter [Clostridium sp.]MCI1814145.1 cation:proton antiporter [Clostridium sp.]MCI1871044.1 cation:proton antiporter [Clostridium sp.]